MRRNAHNKGLTLRLTRVRSTGEGAIIKVLKTRETFDAYRPDDATAKQKNAAVDVSVTACFLSENLSYDN